MGIQFNIYYNKMSQVTKNIQEGQVALAQVKAHLNFIDRVVESWDTK